MQSVYFNHIIDSYHIVTKQAKLTFGKFFHMTQQLLGQKVSREGWRQVSTIWRTANQSLPHYVSLLNFCPSKENTIFFLTSRQVFRGTFFFAFIFESFFHNKDVDRHECEHSACFVLVRSVVTAVVSFFRSVLHNLVLPLVFLRGSRVKRKSVVTSIYYTPGLYHVKPASPGSCAAL